MAEHAGNFITMLGLSRVNEAAPTRSIRLRDRDRFQWASIDSFFGGSTFFIRGTIKVATMQQQPMAR